MRDWIGLYVGGAVIALMMLVGCSPSAPLIALDARAPLTTSVTHADVYGIQAHIPMPSAWVTREQGAGLLLTNATQMGDNVTLRDGQMLIYVDVWSAEDVPYLLCTTERNLTTAEHVALSAVLVPERDNPLPLPHPTQAIHTQDDQTIALIHETRTIGHVTVLAIEKAGGYVILTSVARIPDPTVQRQLLQRIARAIRYVPPP